jgi:hypothetical protein
MKITALCPSRRRPSQLRDSLYGLIDHADHRRDIEVLVAFDPDDETVDEARWLMQPVRQIRTWTAPERYGYGRLHEYYNALAEQAQGDWLLIWNDDARMQTLGWDSIITSSPPRVLWLEANHSPQANMFPAWPRSWAQAAGHVSLSPHCDSWLQMLGTYLGQLRVPIEVRHYRADITGDHEDDTYREGRGQIGTDGYWPGAEPRYTQVVADAQAIQMALNSD